jgi:hypothetical protein
MRKKAAATFVALSMLGGAAAGVALVAPSAVGAQTTDPTTSAAPEGPPGWMADALTKLVSDGTLTQAQADAVASAFAAARPPGGPHGGPGLAAAASAIGIDESALRDALQGGQTIAQVAADHGVPVGAVVDAMVADLQQHLADDVASGRITQEQADQRSGGAASRITDLVNGQRPAGPPSS